MTTYEVTMKPAEQAHVAAIRTTVEDYGHVTALFDQLFQAMAERGLSPAGPPIAICYYEEYTAENVDVETAGPIGEVD
ncbi:MAG: hypothetical protein WBR18_03280 [Anaerolineales bacterium]